MRMARASLGCTTRVCAAGLPLSSEAVVKEWAGSRRSFDVIGRLTLLARLALLAGILAFACLIVGYTKRNELGFEGAYFSRNPSGGSVSTWHVTATPWLIAAGGLLLLSLVLFVADAARRD